MIPASVRIFVCTERQDMRRSFDALALAVKERLDDMVKVKAVNIFASGVEEILHGVEYVGEEFLLIVDRIDERDTVTLRIEVLPTGRPEAVVQEVSKRMHAALGLTLEIDPVEPGTLPKTELKARRWLDRRPRD